jgi:hypothetical protein
MTVACSTVLAAGAVTGAAVLLPGPARPAAGLTDAALARAGAPARPAGPGPSALSPAITSLKAAHARSEVAAALLAARQAAAQQAAAQQAAARRAAAQQAAARQQAPAPPVVPPVSPGSAQQIAMAMLGSYGWPGSQFSCLDDLWSRESGWSTTAENPSGAYGIPQALPGSKMASAGPDWQTDAATQIRWGLGYIKGTYGSPCAAWSHEEATGWY